MGYKFSQWLSNFRISWRACENHKWWGSTTRISDSVGLGWAQEIAKAAALGAMC